MPTSAVTLAHALAAALLLAVPSLSADDERPSIAFNTHCHTCHAIAKGDNRLGPSLNGIVGANAGQVPGFNGYSGALVGITCDEATLDRFIADPQSVAPGTTMISPPVRDAAERHKIIAFLESLSGS